MGNIGAKPSKLIRIYQSNSEILQALSKKYHASQPVILDTILNENEILVHIGKVLSTKKK